MSQPQVKAEHKVKKEIEDNGLGGDTTVRANEKASASSSSSSDDGWQEIPLKSCNKEELNDIRFHIMKFQTKQDVRIVEDFTKPVRLHRKDPRNIQFHLTREEMEIRKKELEALKRERELAAEEAASGATSTKVEGDESVTESKPLTDEASASKDEKKVNPEMAQVAPAGGARKNKKNLFKKKTNKVNIMDSAKRKLRYEEFYPWVVEDYDGKNVFVGNYEGGSADSNQVLFVFDKDGFKVIPAEKVYRFTPRNKYATLTLEEAETKMDKQNHVPRWLMKHMEDSQTDHRFRRNLFTEGRSISRNSNGGGLRTVSGSGNFNDRDSDHDDLDFDEEFADDEEAPIMDGDEEENKLSEQKIKKEMLKAAHFDGQSDGDGDEDLDDLFDTEKSRKVDKEGKKLRKVLNKREGGVYDSEDEDEALNPYLSKSDLESDDDSEEEDVVKKEGEEEQALTDEKNVNVPRSIFALDPGDGFVIIKAPSEFLNGFPKGEWVTNGRKRASPDLVASPKKKLKSEEQGAIVTKEARVSASPTPEIQTGDLNSAGADGALVTIQEVLDIVRDNPLTTKELLSQLKSRASAHPDNKQRIISIVKQKLRLQDKKLVLKDQ